MNLTLATRPSHLARWQTRWVISALRRAWPDMEFEEKVYTTQGDRILDRPLPEIGGKGLFTQELEAELLAGKVQAAVHSLKDLPVEDAPGLYIGAIPIREDVRDVLVSASRKGLAELPERARVGTSSLRRAAQLLAYRPDLRIEPLRGNIDTRVRKALEGQYDAIVLAGAGVRRLGLEGRISETLSLEIMLPAPGQGALAVQCRLEDPETRQVLAPIEEVAARRATEAERAFLAGLGGGCAVPVAAYAVVFDGKIELAGLVASPNGKQVIRVLEKGTDPRTVGMEAARQALAQGAGALLNA